MTVSTWTDQDTAEAQRIWAQYQAEHDLSDRVGQTAGIDPKTGRIWFAESIPEVVAQRDAEGLDSPLRFERVGSETYYRKGGCCTVRKSDSSKKLLHCGENQSDDFDIQAVKKGLVLTTDRTERHG